jgi:hypothetical protein
MDSTVRAANPPVSQPTTPAEAPTSALATAILTVVDFGGAQARLLQGKFAEAEAEAQEVHDFGGR